MAPEIMTGHPYHLAVDIWAIGCIAYEMAQNSLIYGKYNSLFTCFLVATIGAPGYLKERYSMIFLNFFFATFFAHLFGLWLLIYLFQ